MFNNYPIWYLIIDFIFGFLFWILILKFFLNLVFSNDTRVKMVINFFRLTDLIYSKSNFIIPSFLPHPLVAMYLCWLIFMIRFYILSAFTGIDNIGYNVFLLESFVISYFNLIF